MEPYLLKRLWRRPWLSLCSLILSAVLCFLLCYLSGYQQEQKVKLEETKESFDILCVVTDRRGTKSTSLRMPSLAAYFVLDEESGIAEYVNDLRISKEFEYSAPELGIHSLFGPGATLLGVSGERCDELLDPEMGGGATYLMEDFYQSEDYVCLVSESLYERLEEETITLQVTDPYVYSSFNPDLGKGEAEFQVVGYVPGAGETIFIPFAASQRLAYEISGRTSADSIAFLAADNESLEELSEAASELYGTVDPLASAAASPKYALTIHDEQYRATVAALEQNIERSSYLLPFVALLGLAVGFLISFLATRGENRTYALMRTLGLTRGRLFVSILLEQMILCVLAAAVIGVLTMDLIPAAFYLLCHAIGCGVAVIRAIRVAPTAILREQE